MTKKKHTIEAESFEQIYNFVDTYKFWSISDGTDVLFTSESAGISFDKALDKAIDVAIKRNRETLSIRVGSNERNSRFNNEMLIYLDEFYNNQITTVNLQSPYRKTIVLNGKNRVEKNEAGLSAQDIQTYLNGALERQQRELELMAKSQSLEAVSKLRAEMVERELALKREMFEKEMQTERERLKRERDELAEEKAKLREEYDMTNKGLAGVLKGIASVSNEIAGSSLFGNKPKDLKGKDKQDKETDETPDQADIESEDTGFQEVTQSDIEETEESTGNDDFDNILAGFDNLNDDEIEFLQALITERQNQGKPQESKESSKHQYIGNDTAADQETLSGKTKNKNSAVNNTGTGLQHTGNKDPT